MAAITRMAVGALVVAALSSWLVVRSGVAAPKATQPTAPTNDRGRLERLQGFTTVVVNHVNEAMSSELLPIADGGGVEVGMLVTVTLDGVHVFDRRVAALQQGNVTDPTIAPECVSGCPAVLYDAFGRSWLEAAVESTSFAVEIPTRVLMAVHRELPAAMFLQVAYAAAETRPVQPPQLALLVVNSRGSMRALTFFLVPPRGLELRQGSAALGLTIKVSPGGQYHVTATDPLYARDHQVTGLGPLKALAREVKKRYPGKETVIVVPEAGVSVRELVEAAAALQDSFPRLVLSGGQELRTP
jgi:hypothetical protein